MIKANYFSTREWEKHLSHEEKESVSRSEDLQRNRAELWARLNLLRLLLGQPITINSWYRDKAHNDREGGSPTSQHMSGEAVDVTTTDNRALLAVVVKTIKDYNLEWGQIITYGHTNIRFLHLSLPTNKHTNQFLAYD